MRFLYNKINKNKVTKIENTYNKMSAKFLDFFLKLNLETKEIKKKSKRNKIYIKLCTEVHKIAL